MSVTRKTFGVDTDTVRLAGDVWTADVASPTPVVLLHGGGQTRRSWDRAARRLALDGWKAITFDARGHGESEWDPRGDYSLDAFVGDLLAVLEAQGSPSILIGASLGGMTALAAAGRYPDLVSGLVLVDIVVRVDDAGVDRIREFMTGHPDGFGSLEEVADAVAAYNPLRKRPTDHSGLRKNVFLGDDGRWHWHWDPAFMRISDEPQRQVAPRILAAAAERVRCPTLLVRGALSDVVSRDGMDDMLRRIPQAKVASVAATGHMVAGDDNDAFGDVLSEFLAEMPEVRDASGKRV